MSGYILTPTAQEDLTAIRDYYLDEAGYRIARQMRDYLIIY
jgi:plasmid stabilization system protein ParE